MTDYLTEYGALWAVRQADIQVCSQVGGMTGIRVGNLSGRQTNLHTCMESGRQRVCMEPTDRQADRQPDKHFPDFHLLTTVLNI